MKNTSVDPESEKDVTSNHYIRWHRMAPPPLHPENLQFPQTYHKYRI